MMTARTTQANTTLRTMKQQLQSTRFLVCRCLPALVALTGVAWSLPSIEAFQAVVPQTRLHPSLVSTENRVSSTPFQNTAQVFQSSIIQEKSDSNNKRAKKRSWKLPPSPEDQMVMTGDILALFVYCFLDHFMNDMLVSFMNSPASPSVSGNAFLDPITMTPEAALPVWLDSSLVSHFHLPNALIMAHESPSSNLPTYAPAIDMAGTSFVLVTTFWLVSGYFSQAFLFQNTWQCSTRRTLYIAGRTWLVTASMLVLAALMSSVLFLPSSDASAVPVHGLTKADADFIFDTLPVLVLWRVFVNFLFGSFFGRR